MTESVKDQAKRVLEKIEKPEPPRPAHLSGLVQGDELRLAIAESGKTLYRIAKDSGVGHASLWRFMHGRPISIGVFEKLCRYLGLKLKKAR